MVASVRSLHIFFALYRLFRLFIDIIINFIALLIKMEITATLH